MNALNELRAARVAGAPLVAVKTTDPYAFERAAVEFLNGGAPSLHYDVCRGVVPTADKWAGAWGSDRRGVFDAAEFLVAAGEGAVRPDPEAGAIVYVHGLHKWVAEPVVTQALQNLRDVAMGDGIMFVLLGRDWSALPQDLEFDVHVIDESLPSREALEAVTTGTLEDAAIDAGDDDRKAAVSNLVGLNQFAAGQAVAMSIDEESLSLRVDRTAQRKVSIINQSQALRVHQSGMSFDRLGGWDNAKEFFGGVVNGPYCPSLVVLIDELEKALAGSDSDGPGGGDSSGTSQGLLSILLREMAQRAYRGALLFGVPGSGKSAFVEAMAGEAGVPCVELDLVGAKDKHVGESEARVQHAFDVLHAMSGGNAFFCGTCNSTTAIKPEVMRRFGLAQFFCDLPDKQELAAIWPIHIAKYGREGAGDLPNASGWTGAEVELCCVISQWRDCSLKDASQFVSPYSVSSADKLADLRQRAKGSYTSVSYQGQYQGPKSSQGGGKRKMQLG